jgi:hypothetical protein
MFFRCLPCQRDFTLRTGTSLARSHVPLTKWIAAIHIQAEYPESKPVPSGVLTTRINVTRKTALYMARRMFAIRNGTNPHDHFLRELLRELMRPEQVAAV